MKTLMTAVKAFWADEEGATAIEYGLLAALIAVVIIVAVTAVGNDLKAIFQYISGELKKPLPATPPASGGGAG